MWTPKSNIVDAIRWVLGEQSAKALRGGKMQDVIFQGTETRKALQFCEVSLLFADCEAQLGTNFNEVEITRKVHRDGGSDYYINGTDEVGEWRDMHCRIEGGAVSQLQMIFVRMWKKVTGEDIWKQKYFRAYQPVELKGLKPDTTSTAGRKKVGIINREPRTTNEIIRTFYINAFNSAKDSIKLINPYFTLNRKVKRAIKNAIKRGVKVEIMVSAHSDIPLTPACVFYNVHRLMKKGADVWLYQPGFHHSKVIMVDGRYCTIGSANLNARSLSWDYEENAVIIDKPTTQELDNMFDNDKKQSIYLTPEYWKEFRNPWQKFVGWFAHLLTPFL